MQWMMLCLKKLSSFVFVICMFYLNVSIFLIYLFPLILGRKPGRPRKGQGKTPVVSVPKTTEKPAIPDKGVCMCFCLCVGCV